MEEYFDIKNTYEKQLELILRHALFSEFTMDELRKFLEHAQPKLIDIHEGQVVRLSQDYSNHIGAVFSGQVMIYGVDYAGNRLLHKSLSDSQSSGTLFSVLDFENTLVEIEGKTDSLILMLNRDTIYVADESIVMLQHRLLVNMIMAQHALFSDLSNHLYCLCQRSIREKALKFFQFSIAKNRSYEFDIPFSREDLADYLAVDRSALSRSLGELKREGVIDFHKNHFKVLSTQFFTF